MSEFLQAITTVPDRETAANLAQMLVEQRLAACVQQVGPISSTYRWRGKIETTQEWLCIAKTTRESYPKLEAVILKNHPYDVAEILAVPLETGSQAYLDWMLAELKEEPWREGMDPSI